MFSHSPLLARSLLCCSLAINLCWQTAPAHSTNQPPQAPSQASEWRAAAQTEVEAAYQLMRANHPGMSDPDNPGFAAQLAQARQTALEYAQKVTNQGGFRATLASFTTILQDGHAWVGPNLPAQQNTVRWPGFISAWRGASLLVFRSDEENIPAGAQILHCDGVPADALMRQRVFQFGAQENLPGHWWSEAYIVMQERDNPFLPPLQQCAIRIQQETHQVQLKWRPMPPKARQWVDESISGERLPIGRRWLADELLWIALPDFKPGKAEVALYNSMLSQLSTERERVRRARAIVLDLRHNSGGNSTWADKVAGVLWGQALLERAVEAYSARQEVWWRTSPDNITHVAQTIPDKLRELGLQEEADEIAEIGQRMQAAARQGEDFYRAGHGRKTAPSLAQALQAQAGDAPRLTPPVWVIMPGYCASSCLDAIDRFKLFPNTRLIGAPSAADSTYMEVRKQYSPSGLSRLVIPVKLYRNRPRGNNVYYTPDVLHTDLDWGTAGFERKIRSLLPK
ncbi:hypothetical protein V8J88_15905 [Massilia sp. W12]|uniref:hypothetical protein n=1 Tax=Massilia sp. W12 TaxID=3126507 RepID=UPI0030CC4CCB